MSGPAFKPIVPQPLSQEQAKLMFAAAPAILGLLPSQRITAGANLASMDVPVGPSDFVIILGAFRSTLANFSDNLIWRMNGDASASYSYDRMGQFNGAFFATNSTAATGSPVLGDITAANADAGQYAFVLAFFCNLQVGGPFRRGVGLATKIDTFTVRSQIGIWDAYWNSGVPVTRITLLAAGGSIAAGSYFRVLYV